MAPDAEGEGTEKRTGLALERTRLANERTFLAYLRTGLAFLGAGAVLIHFLSGWVSQAGGILFILVGAVALIVGWMRFRAVARRIG